MKFHSLYTFLKNFDGFKQWTTWLAIILIFVYIDYYKDIHYLVSSLVHYDKTKDIILSWFSDLTVAGLITFLTAIKSFYGNDKQ